MISELLALSFYCFQCLLKVIWSHSHKKRKDSLETRAERAVQRAYVQNRDIIESILLYGASKYKQTFSRAIKTVCELPFYLAMWLILAFFLSYLKMQTCQDQTLSKTCCNSCNSLNLRSITNYSLKNMRPSPNFPSSIRQI